MVGGNLVVSTYGQSNTTTFEDWSKSSKYQNASFQAGIA